MGRKISYQLLRSKITDLWKPSEPLTLIDLGHGFYTAKFNKEEKKTTALHGGPRLPQLPTELYDWQILEKIGNHLGSLLRTDSCTSSTLRGRYARICIQIPLGEPVKKAITIGDYMQLVEYEGDGVLCVGYGRVGYTLKNCTFTPPLQTSPVASSSATTTISLTLIDKEEDMWKLVSFPKKRSQKNKFPDQTQHSEARPDTISVDQRRSQAIDNRFNVLSENIPVEKNVQSPTVADKTLKDPHYLANVVKEAIDHSVHQLGNQLWMHSHEDTNIHGLCAPSHSGSQPTPNPNISEPTLLPNSNFQCHFSGPLLHLLEPDGSSYEPPNAIISRKMGKKLRIKGKLQSQKPKTMKPGTRRDFRKPWRSIPRDFSPRGLLSKRVQKTNKRSHYSALSKDLNGLLSDPEEHARPEPT
ncbi:hypothetical protein BC332_26526 [Capsicum chinense]|nr:hypothetical protein BC332_26526 [Capsicum chinense]